MDESLYHNLVLIPNTPQHTLETSLDPQEVQGSEVSEIHTSQEIEVLGKEDQETVVGVQETPATDKVLEYSTHQSALNLITSINPTTTVVDSDIALYNDKADKHIS